MTISPVAHTGIALPQLAGGWAAISFSMALIKEETARGALCSTSSDTRSPRSAAIVRYTVVVLDQTPMSRRIAVEAIDSTLEACWRCSLSLLLRETAPM